MKIKQIDNPQDSADIIYNIAAEYCDFHQDQNGDMFLVSYIDNNYDLKYLSNSDDVKMFLTQLHFEEYNHTAKPFAVKTAYENIVAVANAYADKMSVYTRVGRSKDTLYYDLCNNDGEVIAIDENDVYIVYSNEVEDLFFRRDVMMKEQVEPIQNDEYKLLDFIDEFFNVDEDLKLLLAVYVCVAFVPLIDHPILIVEGEKGSGKTTFLNHLGDIINPTKKSVLTLPTNKSDLITALSNNYFAPFDNIGKISDEFANVFCQASTGGTMTKRKLFTDNTEYPIDFKRLVALNGINMGIAQSDLLDRAILIRLERFKDIEYKPLQFVTEHFNQHLPYALGDIFTILSKALKILPSVNLNTFERMGDFMLYGYAVAEAIKSGYGKKFCDDYIINRNLSSKAVIEENPLLEAIEFFAEKHNYWRGTATDLLKLLQQCLREKYGCTNSDLMRIRPNAMSQKLKTHTHELKTLGIKVKVGRSKERYVEVTKNDTKQSSIPTNSTIKNNPNTKNRKTLLDDDD